MRSLIRFLLFVSFLWVLELPAATAKHHIVFLAGESLYGSETTLPIYADRLKKKYGYQCTTLVRTDKDKFPNLEVLSKADLVVFYMRRMTLSEDQLGQVKLYIESGRPVIGLRTASHAMQNWLAFDKLVLGGNYQGHHKNELIGKTSKKQGASSARQSVSYRKKSTHSIRQLVFGQPQTNCTRAK